MLSYIKNKMNQDQNLVPAKFLAQGIRIGADSFKEITPIYNDDFWNDDEGKEGTGF